MDDKTVGQELRAIVGERFVLTDPSELRPYECDGNTIFKKLPRAVVLPGHVLKRLARVVRLLAGSGIPFIPARGGDGAFERCGAGPMAK